MPPGQIELQSYYDHCVQSPSRSRAAATAGVSPESHLRVHSVLRRFHLRNVSRALRVAAMAHHARAFFGSFTVGAAIFRSIGGHAIARRVSAFLGLGHIVNSSFRSGSPERTSGFDANRLSLDGRQHRHSASLPTIVATLARASQQNTDLGHCSSPGFIPRNLLN